ncbi:MAG: hypothetical protein IKI09_05550 [Bacteroidales bacterium]|nr:hypothetical protein [Bacteroidales bacterium]
MEWLQTLLLPAMVTRIKIKQIALMLFVSIQIGLAAQTNLSLCYEMNIIPRIERYNRSLDSIVSARLGDIYLVRLVVTPSFDPEYALQVELAEQSYLLKVISFDQNLWYAKDVASISVLECIVGMETQFAEQMLEIVKHFMDNRISTVSFPCCVDGDTYQFEIRENGAIVCGQVHEPAPNSPLGKLCSLCNLIKDCCLMGSRSDAIVKEEILKLLQSITEITFAK